MRIRIKPKVSIPIRILWPDSGTSTHSRFENPDSKFFYINLKWLFCHDYVLLLLMKIYGFAFSRKWRRISSTNFFCPNWSERVTRASSHPSQEQRKGDILIIVLYAPGPYSSVLFLLTYFLCSISRQGGTDAFKTLGSRITFSTACLIEQFPLVWALFERQLTIKLMFP